jgi:hypothetical protein
MAPKMRRQLKGVTVAHALPGRVRLKIPRVKENPELARRAKKKLSQVPGIQGVEANPATGSLLILYDLAMLASVETLGPLGEIFADLFPEVSFEELTAGLQELMETGAAAPSTGSLMGVFNTAGNPVLLRNLNLNLLLPLTLLFLGVRGLTISRETAFPAWYDYLWFAFSTFVMLNRRWVEGTTESSPAPWSEASETAGTRLRKSRVIPDQGQERKAGARGRGRGVK